LEAGHHGGEDISLECDSHAAALWSGTESGGMAAALQITR
jgi:hypothetical protein